MSAGRPVEQAAASKQRSNPDVLSAVPIPSPTTVQLSVIALNVLYAVIGVVLMYLSYRVIDLLTPEVDFRAELQKGNVAVAIFMASIFISIALIIGKALG
jgi:uncharacterized membrane protein YjfL (UPF0719 family)